MSRLKRTQVKYEAWIAQAEWIVRFLEKLRDAPSAHGLSWTQAMVDHYAGKYHNHLSRMPKACKKQAGEFTSRVEKILAWLDKQS